MKKIFTIVILLAALSVFAQKNVAKQVQQLVSQNVLFKPVTAFTVSQVIENTNTKKAVENATYATLNSAAIAAVMTHKYENIELQVPYQGRIIAVQLYKIKLFSDDFHLDTNKNRNVAYEPGVYYRGIVKGDEMSVASVSFFNNEINGLVSANGMNNLVIGKLDKKGNTSDYIIYSDAQLKIANTFSCATKDDTVINMSAQKSAESSLTDKCVTVFFEIDHDIYLRNNSSVAETNNWMSAVFNNVQTLYANDGISTALKSVYVWETEDPYSGESSSDYLFQFNDNTCVFDGDVGQLVGIDSGGLGGVAVGINGLCSQNNFSYSDVDFSFSEVPTFSWTIEVITHELGHLFGSPHTHACVWNGNNTAIDNCAPFALGEDWEGGNCMTNPANIPSSTDKGSIMSYCHLVGGVGIKFANGFGPQPAALLRNRVNNAGCLGANCNNSCINTVCKVVASDVTASSAKIEWEETNAATTSWKMSIAPYSSTTDNWTVVNSNMFNSTSLLPNTYYKVKISPNCGSSFEAPTSETVFLTAADYCDGIVLTDAGGISGNYDDNQTVIRTIIPNISGKKIKLAFSFFELESDYDYLYVYNGNSTSATDMTNGGLTGFENPGTFVSTAADGALTIKFVSDGGVVEAGFVANVSCETRLGINGFEPEIDFTYYPNPTNGIVAINATTSMSELAVYNVSGQLLYTNKINALETKVDMSAYSTGMYFLKLKFNDKEVNFKIQKN